MERIRIAATMPVPDYLKSFSEGSRTLRIGLPRKLFYEDLDPEIAAAVESALGTLRVFASDLVEIEIDVPTDRTVQTAEAYAYHAEFVSRSPELYQPETLRRIRKSAGNHGGRVGTSPTGSASKSAARSAKCLMKSMFLRRFNHASSRAGDR